MAPFYGWGLTTSRLQSHYDEEVYFLPLNSQKSWFLFDQPQKDERLSELNLEPPSGLEQGTPGLTFQHLN